MLTPKKSKETYTVITCEEAKELSTDELYPLPSAHYEALVTLKVFCNHKFLVHDPTVTKDLLKVLQVEHSTIFNALVGYSPTTCKLFEKPLLVPYKVYIVPSDLLHLPPKLVEIIQIDLPSKLASYVITHEMVYKWLKIYANQYLTELTS